MMSRTGILIAASVAVVLLALWVAKTDPLHDGRLYFDPNYIGHQVNFTKE